MINFELFDYIVGNELVYYQIDDPNMYTQTHHTVIGLQFSVIMILIMLHGQEILL